MQLMKKNRLLDYAKRIVLNDKGNIYILVVETKSNGLHFHLS